MNYKVNSRNNILLSIFFIVEFLLFRSFILREICNMIPSDVDQSVYLNESYNIYKNIVDANYRSALGTIFNTANTGLPVLGAIMLFLFGQSRLGMLIPNFIGFISLQLVGYKTINKIYGNERAGWGYIGILLLTNTTFGWAANLTSFRADFLFACLFSIWIILLFEAVRTEDKKLYVMSAVVSGFMLFVRFYSICFLVPIIMVETIIFFWQYKEAMKTFRHLCIYIGGVIAGGGWFFLVNILNFIRYYLGAMTNDMKDIWQIDLSLLENLAYYPKYFIDFHMGKNLAISLLIIGIICVVLEGIKKVKLDEQNKRACLILILAFVVPYALLMISNKQPLVISIWNGVYIFAILFIVGIMNRAYTHHIIRLGIEVFSCVLIVVGSMNYILNASRHFEGAYIEHSDIESIWKLNCEIGEWADLNEQNEINIVLDRWNDVISLDSLELCAVENVHKWIDFRYAIGEMNGNFATLQFGTSELYDGLSRADVIVVAKEGYNYPASFPTDQLLDAYHNEIYCYATENFELLDTFDWRNNELMVYVKRPIAIDAEWQDWLGVQNRIHFCKEEGDELLVVEGNNMEGIYPQLKVKAMDVESQQMLETTVEVEDGRYKISVNVSELPNGNTEIALSFDSFYVPSEISDSADTRKLAVLYPDKYFIEKGTEKND